MQDLRAQYEALDIFIFAVYFMFPGRPERAWTGTISFASCIGTFFFWRRLPEQISYTIFRHASV
jgi:hypothetical protein